jgi:hypothetical protein
VAQRCLTISTYSLPSHALARVTGSASGPDLQQPGDVVFCRRLDPQR